MSPVTKALRRFLTVYAVIILLLVSVGSVFFYHLSVDRIAQRSIADIRAGMERFIAKNRGRGILRSMHRPDFPEDPLAVVVGGKVLYSNFEIPDGMELPGPGKYRIEKGRIYYLLEEHKRRGKIALLGRRDLREDLDALRLQVTGVGIVLLMFAGLLGFWLGRRFVEPMREAQKRLEAFVDEAIHEINTPVSILSMNLEILQEHIGSGEGREEMERIARSAKRISEIFRDLAFVRLSHHPSRRVEAIDIGALLRERISQQQYPDREISLEIEGKEPVILMADREEFGRLVDNLLGNALKHSVPGSRVELRLDRKSLRFRNVGRLGESKELMRPFSRGETQAGGFGLGLAIVEKICKRNDYRFELYQDGEKVVAEIFWNA